jgi:hypothetical protein
MLNTCEFNETGLILFSSVRVSRVGELTVESGLRDLSV